MIFSQSGWHAQTAMIENGFVYIPQDAPWLAEYLHEMIVFPNGKHDDQVDSTAQFLDWFKKPFPGQNIFEFYRREDEKLKHPREPEKRKPPRPVNVRVKAPPGIGYYMADLTLTTFDWVPETPRGYVRDIRVRWALEEARLPYRVESTPFRGQSAEQLAHQPFGQVPWLTDGDISIFESGAILLHLGERSDEGLMPADPGRRCEALEWLFAALNSLEMASLPWTILAFPGDTDGAFTPNL